MSHRDHRIPCHYYAHHFCGRQRDSDAIVVDDVIDDGGIIIVNVVVVDVVENPGCRQIVTASDNEQRNELIMGSRTFVVI